MGCGICVEDQPLIWEKGKMLSCAQTYCKVALNNLFPVTSPFAEQFGLVLFSWSEMQSVGVSYILLLTAFDGVSS